MKRHLILGLAISTGLVGLGAQLAYGNAPQDSPKGSIEVLEASSHHTLTRPTRVVELFTSQGCSSCPRSNAILSQFDADPDILGLTYGVEYWDYLGWKDTFADPEFSSRQRAYSEALGHGRVYTPQMVVNGAVDKPRFSNAEVRALSLPKAGPKLTLSASGKVEVSEMVTQQTASLRLIRYVPGVQSVAVKKGENGGRTLSLSNVVTQVHELGQYHGRASSFTLPALSPDASGGTAFAVLLQEGQNGPILSAINSQP